MSDLAGGSTGGAAPVEGGADFSPAFEDTSRKLSIAFAAAVALHAALLIPMFAANTLQMISSGPMVVDLQAEDIDTGTSAAAVAPAAPEPAAAAAVAVAPAAPAAPAAAPARTASSGASDFVIPTPKTAVDPGAAPASAAPSFRTSGGQTGVTAPLGSPDVQPKPSNMTSGSASATAPTKGSATTVQGPQGSASGSLDYGSLDQSLKGSSPAGSTAGTAKAASAGTPGPSATGGSSGIQWSRPSVNREPLFELNPKIPAWVGQQGLGLKVTVSFTVLPDGTVTSPKVEKTSGYADVNAAVLEALRSWRFKEDPTSPAVTGVLTYVIRVK